MAQARERAAALFHRAHFFVEVSCAGMAATTSRDVARLSLAGLSLCWLLWMWRLEARSLASATAQAALRRSGRARELGPNMSARLHASGRQDARVAEAFWCGWRLVACARREHASSRGRARLARSPFGADAVVCLMGLRRHTPFRGHMSCSGRRYEPQVKLQRAGTHEFVQSVSRPACSAGLRSEV